MKKGFTLIELLAVIVILAIISIIAVPTITKVVDNSRKKAAEVSALNYIDAVEKYVILNDVNPTKYPYDIKGGTFNVATNTELSLLDVIIPKVKAKDVIPSLNSFINIKGEKPKSGTITINEKGKVTAAVLVIKGYSIKCTGSSCETKGGNDTSKVVLKIVTPESTNIDTSTPLVITVTTNSNDVITWTSSDESVATVSDGVVTGVKMGSVVITASIGDVSDSLTINVVSGATIELKDIYSVANVKQQGVKGIVYLNPSNLGEICNESNSTVGTGTTGCMKWYIFKEDSDKYYLLLDHNAVEGVVWSKNSPTPSYESSDAYTVINNLNWESSLNRRLISTSEINAITGKTGFDVGNTASWYYPDYLNTSGYPKGQGTSKYAWLYDYTYKCAEDGCNVSSNNKAYGYWTSDIFTGNTTEVWFIYMDGGRIGKVTSKYEYCGVRPVIEVSKSNFK